ncbi:uncharacterized protein LOC107483223 [Arachis duranensis]|uniref:Uncharacterized protein LOC107483223 n=1 Tax=Arachis duranensis TaxID=130453 RepID=A0A6P4CYE7_ARADU|nr:uncharacterized protein LOC107483223 [Arachis duranensis]
MGQMIVQVVLVAVMVVLVGVAGATPPGIAKNPSHATCKIKKYKHCYNLEHVCPKFCPDGCTVECASCKPICAGGSNPTPSPSETPSTPSYYPPPSTPSTPSSPPPQTPSPSTPSSTPPPTTPSSPPPSTPSPTPPQTPSSPTPPQTPSPSTPTPPSGPKTARCRNKNYPKCYNMQFTCPSACPAACEVDCNTCKPVCNCDRPGAVCQDPRFIGGDGTTFYFHGKKDTNFCLVSDPNLHINAHFIGRRSQNMKRDFTWVQSIAILFNNNHTLFIGAQKTAAWDDSNDRVDLSFDGQPITLPQSEGATWTSQTSPSVTVSRAEDSATNSVVLEVEGKLKVSAKVVPITEEDSRIHSYGVTEEDCFAHLDLGFKFLDLSREVSGVLGQTYKENYVSRLDIGAKMAVMGGSGSEFESSSLFSTDCSVSRFVGDSNNIGEKSSFEGLSCQSGIDGQGVVCRR